LLHPEDLIGATAGLADQGLRVGRRSALAVTFNLPNLLLGA
jgi:hypothetical protein